MSAANRIRIWAFVLIIGVLYLLIQFGIELYTDYLWFQHLNLESVYLTQFWARLGVGLAVAVPFAVLFWLNAFIARWQSVRNVLFFSDETLVAQRFVAWVIWGGGLVLAWAVGTAASNNWLQFLLFLNRQSFNLADPIFNQDVGFYIFSLPLYHFGQTWLVISLFLSLIGAVGVYALAQQNNLAEGRLVILPHVQLHLSVVGALIFFAFAFGHWLGLFDLMYSTRGVASGPSYTDVRVSIPALQVMIVVALLTAAILLANTFLRRPALSLLAIFVWIIVGIVGNGFIPGVIQRYVVEPNELAYEGPYIENNIRFTNIAYGLDKIQERDFPEVEPLTPDLVQANESFLKNIRLWDYRPLQQTYQQIQAIRLYYHFYDIDLDRYTVGGETRQVALSARELDKTQLQSPTWITQKLQFTHGYGVVVNPINEVTREGLPSLWVKDLPPQSTVPELAVERPEIYYGEAESDHVFVNTTEREFDYPSGDQNVFTQYEGSGGVVMDSYLKRVAFALRLADANTLLSREFTPQSRVLFNRNIRQRVEEVAPFLEFDGDPYIVIGEDGHLYWMLDAYTTSRLFPYAERVNNINYIRNSVKILIDAYNGSMIFYVVDSGDPLIKAYEGVFPQLFTPMAQMPEWVRRHIRYPEDLFRVQVMLYQTYHMRDVNVFYNKEDLWQVPNENFGGQAQPVEPYYVMLKLPGETEGGTEFVLIQPFTPNNKDNLISWLAARSDGENYGQLVNYRFPKQELIFGPLQIEGRIDQNPEISSQITLWDQGGSEVIRGNLLVLPIDNALLYVEPLYLRAENGQIPELKRIVVASGDTIVMRETLERAFAALFEGGNGIEAEDAVESPNTPPSADAVEAQPTPAAPAATNEALANKSVTELAELAAGYYDSAQTALREGDWTTYGNDLDKMEEVLRVLVEVSREQANP
jgi:uncharacterized protein